MNPSAQDRPRASATSRVLEGEGDRQSQVLSSCSQERRVQGTPKMELCLVPKAEPLVTKTIPCVAAVTRSANRPEEEEPEEEKVPVHALDMLDDLDTGTDLKYPKLPFSVKGEEEEEVKGYCFVDSMAGVNLVSRAFLKRAEEKVGHIGRIESNQPIQPAIGEAKDITESVQLSIKVGNSTYMIQCHVTELVITDLLLGVPWCEEAECLINFPCRTITARGEVIPFEEGIQQAAFLAAYVPNGQEVLYLHAMQEVFQDSNGEELRAKGLKQASLTKEQHQQLEALKKEFEDRFQPPGVPPSRVPGEEMRIDLVPGAQPISRPCPRMSKTALEAARKIVQDMVAKGILAPSNSPWGSPMILIPKRDDEQQIIGWRFVVDYRALNAVTLPHRYPLPRIDALLEQAAQGRIFSGFDLTDGFYQMNMSPEAQDISAVTTPFGSFNWTAMAMGLAGSPTRFQQAADRWWSGLRNLSYYIDDVLVHSQTFEEHIQDLRRFLERARDMDIYLKPSKAFWAYTRINFLGHTLSEGEIAPMRKHVQNMKDLMMKRPATQGELNSLLCLLSWYRPFLKGFGQIAAPLYNQASSHKPKKKLKVDWDADMINAMKKLAILVAKMQPLLAFRYDSYHRLRTDASSSGAGAVLEQAIVTEDAMTTLYPNHPGLQEDGDELGGEGIGLPGAVYSEGEEDLPSSSPAISRDTEHGNAHTHLLERTRTYIPPKDTEVWVGKEVGRITIEQLFNLENHNLVNYAPVAFFSKKWSPTQRNYATWKQELVALKMGLECFQDQLLGRSGNFRVEVDNASLSYYMTKPSGSLRTIELNLLEFISRFAPLDLRFLPGAKNLTADLLSRIEDNQSITIKILDAYAGSSSLTRAVEIWYNWFRRTYPKIDIAAINLQYVEQDPDKRELLGKAHRDLLQKEVPVTGDPWVIGRLLDHRMELLQTEHSEVRDFLDGAWKVAGPPCQPFSRAGKGKGLADDRSGFEKTAEAVALPGPYIVENVKFKDHLKDQKERVDQLLGTTGKLTQLAGPQARQRILWRSPEPTEEMLQEARKIAEELAKEEGLALSWQQALDKAAREKGQAPDATAPEKKSRTVMTKMQTWNRSAQKVNRMSQEKWDDMRLEELAALVGLHPDDVGQEEALARELLGNAIPVIAQVENLVVMTLPMVKGLARDSSNANQGFTSIEGTGGNEFRGSQPQTPILAAAMDIMGLAREAHRATLHAGVDRMMAYIEKKYGIREGVSIKTYREACKTVKGRCPFCQMYKPDSEKQAVRRVLPLALGPVFSELVIDECVGLPSSKLGKDDAFVTIICRTSQYVIARPFSTKAKSDEMIRLLSSVFATVTGVPRKIWADNGSRFTSSRTKEYLKEKGVTLSLGTPYWHATQGEVERAHGQIQECLSALMYEQRALDYCDPSDWPDYLDEAVMMINNAPRDGLEGESPAKVALGRVILTSRVGPTRAWSDWRRVVDLVVTRHHLAKLRRADSHNQKSKIDHEEFREGTFVKMRKAQKTKLGQKFDGPYLITKVNPVTHSCTLTGVGADDVGSFERRQEDLIKYENDDSDESWGDLAEEEEEDQGSQSQTPSGHTEDQQKWPVKHYLLLRAEGTSRKKRHPDQVWVMDDQKATWWAPLEDVQDDVLNYLEAGWLMGYCSWSNRFEEIFGAKKDQFHKWTRNPPTESNISRIRVTAKNKDKTIVDAIKQRLL